MKTSRPGIGALVAAILFAWFLALAAFANWAFQEVSKVLLWGLR